MLEIIQTSNIILGLPVPLSAVRRMDIYEEQVTTMRVRWEAAKGATGYMLLYNAINATQPSVEQEVRYMVETLRAQCASKRAHSQSAVDTTGKKK